MPTFRVDPAQVYRNQQRAMAIVMHGTHWCHCDLCNQVKPLEYHEIYQRALTLNNAEARTRSFNRMLCALLCRECHASAETETIARVLMQRNAALYGFQQVMAAFEAFERTMFTSVRNYLDEE